MTKIIKLGTLNPNSNQRRIIFDKDYLVPTLQAAMGNGGGQVPMIVVEDEILCSNLSKN